MPHDLKHDEISLDIVLDHLPDGADRDCKIRQMPKQVWVVVDDAAYPKSSIQGDLIKR